MRMFLLLCGAVAVLAGVTALPVGADTPATFTLTPAGLLSISAPTTSVSLGSQMSSNTSSTMTGQLGVVTVSDQRGGSQVWTASVIATAFTPPSGPADPASSVSYAAGPITLTGAVTATAVAAPNLTGVAPVVNGTGTGVGTASWNPTISVIVPANFAAGTYAATITHSVA